MVNSKIARALGCIGILAAVTACGQRSSSGALLPSTDLASSPARAVDALQPDIKVKFAEFKLPKAYSGPTHITKGPGKTQVLWFTEHGANAIGTITVDGVVKERPLSVRPEVQAAADFERLLQGPPIEAVPIPTITTPPSGNAPYGIAVGSDGKIWMTNINNYQNMIVKYTSAKTLSYLVNRPCCLQNIARGPDGNLWFPVSNSYDLSTNAIGRVTPKGAVTIFDIASSTVPSNVTGGPDKALWFTEEYANRIGRMTTAGTVTAEYDVPTSNSQPVDIVKGPDGNLWFTQWSGNKIGRVTPKGKMTEFPVKSSSAGLAGITVGPDKALWFTEVSAGKIGRITTGGAVTEFKIPTPGSSPFFITLGPDNNLWFTEYAANKIGRIEIL